MIEVQVNHLGTVQFEVNARYHRIYCDQPTDAGGFDEGMTPPELFLGALGSCAGYYAVQYLDARDLPTLGVAIRVTAEKAKSPARLDDLHITIDYPRDLTTAHRDGLQRAVEKCLIHNTLLHSPRITTEIVTAPAAALGSDAVAAPFPELDAEDRAGRFANHRVQIGPYAP